MRLSAPSDLVWSFLVELHEHLRPADQSHADPRAPIRVHPLIDEPRLSPQLILRLQTTSGNRAVQKLIERRAMLPAVEPTLPAESGQSREATVSPVPPNGPAAPWWCSFLKLFHRGESRKREITP
jgi:hypothetical protein